MKVIGLLILGVAIGLLNAWGITLLWKWYVVPFGIIQIGIVHAYGLGLIYSIFKGYKKPENDEIDWTSIIASPVYCWLLVFFGYLAQFFM